MFSDSTTSVKFSDSPSGSNVVNIPSTWPSNRPSKTELSVQTDYISISEKEVQSAFRSDAKVQTDPDPTDLSSSINQLNVLDSTDKLLSRNETLSLNQFLSTIESTVSNLLIQNVRSRAFDEFSSQFEYMKSLFNPNVGDAKDIIETLYELSDESILHNDLSLETIAIDWSKTGQSVGILYGSKGGSVWGTQRGYFCSWNLASKQLNPRKADITVEIPSSPMHLAYHPDLPNLIIVSTFTGSLHLIDTAALLSSSESSYIVASSENDNHSHHEPVSSVVWISARSLNLNPQVKKKIQHIGQYFILSAGNDGNLLIYGLIMRPDGSSLSPVLNSQLLASHVPQHLRTTGILSKSEIMDGMSDLKPDVPLGISHTALPPSNLPVQPT
ncbi:hypothetical protein BKA69DRAFT_591146 [Paraphysoderma sedebokerense]|nr:hypothetical protein BKA69DRAFT_591146 [Paraphysoderma sedebokerense]